MMIYLLNYISDNNKMILSPCIIASNSSIINNSSIIIRPINHITLKRIECKTIELVLKPIERLIII